MAVGNGPAAELFRYPEIDRGYGKKMPVDDLMLRMLPKMPLPPIAIFGTITESIPRGAEYSAAHGLDLVFKDADLIGVLYKIELDLRAVHVPIEIHTHGFSAAAIQRGKHAQDVNGFFHIQTPNTSFRTCSVNGPNRGPLLI